MFREMRRSKQEISSDECRSLLIKEPRGVLAVNGDGGYPYAFPIDYYYDQAADRIFFHCAREGHKIDAIKKNDKVSFCVYNSGFRREGDWALYISSVIVFGRIKIVDDVQEAGHYLQKIAEKYMPAEEEKEMNYQEQLKRLYMLSMTIDHMSGKLVHEK